MYVGRGRNLKPRRKCVLRLFLEISAALKSYIINCIKYGFFTKKFQGRIYFHGRLIGSCNVQEPPGSTVLEKQISSLKQC